MMLYQLSHATARHNAMEAIRTAPEGYIVTIKPRTRTLAQNSLMWSVLTDLSRQVEFCVNGKLVHVSPEDVKTILTAGLKREMRMATGIDGGVVFLGTHTSSMTVREMNDLIDLAHAYGNDRGVTWSDASIGAVA